MKSRLTITLTQDLLEKVDNIIDGQEIRNRSHAIENLIRKSLIPTIKRVVILAGGKKKGDTLPLLAPINDQPLIFVLIDHLKKYGVSEFIICAGKNEAKIKKVLSNSEIVGIKIVYPQEKSLLGTAGAVKNARQYLQGEPFLVVHGDILIGMDFSGFINFHRNENSLATVAVKPRKMEKSYGKVLLQGNKITHFVGTDKQDQGISIVNTGVYLFEPTIFNYIPNKPVSSFEKDVFPRLAEKGELSAFIFQGVWADISLKKNRRQAVSLWNLKNTN